MLNMMLKVKFNVHSPFPVASGFKFVLPFTSETGLTHEDPKYKSQTFSVLPKEEVEKEVVFSKVNVGGEEIAGAKIQIKDAQGQVVKEWTSKAG